MAERMTFEQRPLADCPPDLIELGGDDQWADIEQGGEVVSAVVVMGNHVTVWQDNPLTDKDKAKIADYVQERRDEGIIE
jgi:hypothetical protein